MRGLFIRSIQVPVMFISVGLILAAFSGVGRVYGFTGGTGQPNDPYQISVASDLYSMVSEPNLWDKHFVLTKDIDLDPHLSGGEDFTLWIAGRIEFAGRFDGNGHVIRNMTLESDEPYQGLFAQIDPNGSVLDLGLEDVNIIGHGHLVGALAGINQGHIAGCYSTGRIQGDKAIGGLVGQNGSFLTDSNSTSIHDCYSHCDVNGVEFVGGLVGFNTAPLFRCYSTGPVWGEFYVGGLVVGVDDLNDCFWDTEIAWQADNYGGIGLSTGQMQDVNTYLDAGWDFVGETANGPNDIWWMEEGQGYPRLWREPLRNKVLIIGIDGTMPSALAVADTPNLDALIAEGSFSDRAITHPVTHSAACWSSMFTGVWGDKHGVNDPGNSFAGNRFDLYPSFFKRLEEIDPALSTVAYLRWAPLSTALAGTDTVQAFGSDAAITTATTSLLADGDPDVFYTILLDVDSAGHSAGWGPDVPGYVAAIETADTRVGQIIAALTSRPTYAKENWLLLVLSDHGQHDNTVERSQVTFHLVWGPDAARGRMWPSPSIVDVCATVLTHMGVSIDPDWNLDARIEGLPLAPITYGTNLIFNGDAEANSSTNGHSPNRGIAWWFDPYEVTLGGYATAAEFPDLASPGPPERGRNFFLGGAATASIIQIIDLESLADDIDRPGSDYVLSGWFGGTAAQNDTAWLEARFLDATDGELGRAEVGRVTAADRGNVTGLFERWTAGSLPTGTRRVQFIFTSEAVQGQADGFADNLSFVLTPSGNPPR